MPVTCVERPRQASEGHYLRPGATREWLVAGTTVKLTAQLAVINTSPETDSGFDSAGNQLVLFRDTFSMKEEGGGVWSATVRYESSADVTDMQFNFGTTSIKIYQALEHIRSYDLVNGGIDTDAITLHNGVIGVNGDEVEGVDIEASNVEITITKKYRRTTIPATYFQTLMDIMDLYTPVNNADFDYVWKGLTLTFPLGSLRLRGCPIKWTSMDEVEISYHFHYSRPIILNDDFHIGEGDAIEKEGHEYGWISYKLTTSNGTTTRTPESYNVEKVYPKRNFNSLLL